MKHNILMQMEQETFVTLRVRVWIETEYSANDGTPSGGHPPREGVD